MFYKEEISAGCEVTFRPTVRQLTRFVGLADLHGNLTGTVLREVLGVGWLISVHGKTASIAIDAISILSEKACLRTPEGRLVSILSASKKLNGGWNVKAR